MEMLRIVILTLISIFICCAFAGDSYQESKPGNEKRKSEVSGNYRLTIAYNYSDLGGTLENIKEPKTPI